MPIQGSAGRGQKRRFSKPPEFSEKVPPPPYLDKKGFKKGKKEGNGEHFQPKNYWPPRKQYWPYYQYMEKRKKFRSFTRIELDLVI